MKRNGKIAQLPEDIRNQINYRLLLKHPGAGIVKWLNKLPEVKAVMAERFDGRPLNGRNLSEWKNAAYKEWHREFTNDGNGYMLDPVFRRHYFSLLDTWLRDAVLRLQRYLVREILDALNKQAQSEKAAQGNPANN